VGRVLLVSVLLLPIIEIAIFIKVGQTIGLWWTLGLIIAAGIFGALLLRQQGASVLMRMRSSFEQRQVPAKTIAEAMMIGLAAILLLLPGFLSDIAGIALLLPSVRSWIYSRLASRFVTVRAAGPGDGYPQDRRIGTIDLDEDDYRPK
jgi:UPF0716 protein FxsA